MRVPQEREFPPILSQIAQIYVHVQSYAVQAADVDSLAEIAQKELQALEFANVHSILEGNNEVHV